MKKFSIFTIAAFIILFVSQSFSQNFGPTSSYKSPVFIVQAPDVYTGALWNEIDSLDASNQPAQIAPDYPFQFEMADDFIVPAGQMWAIDSIDMTGVYNSVGPMTSMRVSIYTDTVNAGNHRPSSVKIFQDSAIIPITPVTNASPTFKLHNLAILGPGRYWYSGYTLMAFTPGGQYFWNTRILRGANALFKDYTNVFAGGTDWRILNGPRDMSFRLRGQNYPPPVAPILFFPANNATNLPVSDTLRWNRSLSFGVPTYRVQVATDAGFTTIIVNDSTVTDSTKAISGLNYNTPYWWRVSAKNLAGTSAYSTVFMFTTLLTPAPPTLIAPLNNALGIIPTPLTDWSSVPTATGYRIQISNDPNFPTAQLDSITNVDSLLVPAGRLLNNTQYWWHVYAINAAGHSAYSGIFTFTTSLLGITNNGIIPKVFKLYDAYPNPFNPATIIKFDIPKSADVKMVVYNILGEQVATLVNSHFDAGAYSVTWDAANFASGVYFYKITAANYTGIHKMALIK
jgi:hypothetical protein